MLKALAEGARRHRDANAAITVPSGRVDQPIVSGVELFGFFGVQTLFTIGIMQLDAEISRRQKTEIVSLQTRLIALYEGAKQRQ